MQEKPAETAGNAYDYDVVVIGAGPGGYVAAIRCAMHGLKTAVAEAADCGGTCLNRGCIPAKVLLHPSEIYETMASEAAGIGVHADNLSVDYSEVYKFKEQVVKRMSGGVEKLLKSRKVAINVHNT